MSGRTNIGPRKDWLNTELSCPFCGAHPTTNRFPVQVSSGYDKQLYRCRKCKEHFRLEVDDDESILDKD